MEAASLLAAGPTQPGGSTASAANPTQSVAGIPTDLSELTHVVVTLRKRWVQVAAARGARGEQLTPEQLAGLEEFFRVAGAVSMSPELRTATRLDAAMEAVLKPGYHFPEPFKTQARELLDAWTASHWGGPPPGEQAAEEEEQLGQQAEGVQPVAAAQPTPPAQPAASHQIRRPNPAHPIYGINGIMRGILVARGQRGRIYIFDPNYPLRRAAVFGHNGLAVGQWWPLQKAAQRDGAHGSAQAGIYGRAGDGAYSVVVSGAYADLDGDEGDRIHYSGSGSHGHSDTTPRITAATSTLQRSQETGLPIRVLRAASGSGRAPVVGIRYDGLYTVVSSRIRLNGTNGAYIQFCLQRLPNQPPIDLTRPTYNERLSSQSVSDGY